MSETTPIPIQFGTQLAQHASGQLSHELAENLYLEFAPKGSKFSHILLGTPGLEPFVELATAPVRGCIYMAGYLWAVSGDRFYRVDESGSAFDCGEVPGTGSVRLAENGTHVWIATEAKIFAANADEILELTLGLGTNAFVGVANQDGYMIGAQIGGQQFWISGLDDATTIDPLDFSSADAFGDMLVGCISDHRELLLFKERSTEVWYNAGAAAFPFQRSQVIERGCMSVGSIAKAENLVFWLGNDLQIYAMSGYQPQPISTEVVTTLIEAEVSPQTSVGFTYQQAGHTFYCLNFDDLSISYDLRTQLWSKRKSDEIERWRVSCHAWADGWKKHIVGDYETGELYLLKLDTYDEGGRVLRRRAIGAPVWNRGLRVKIDEFYLDIEAGVGLITGQGSDPQAMLDWSSNGGKTWSNELWRSFGAVGEYGVRARWANLGSHRLWVPRITITDPVPVRIAGAYIRPEMLSL